MHSLLTHALKHAQDAVVPSRHVHGGERVKSADSEELSSLLVKRVNIPYNSSSPAGLIEADTVDPWSRSGKYALGWVYFAVILLVLVSSKRFFYIWKDKISTAEQDEQSKVSNVNDMDEKNVMSPHSTTMSLQSATTVSDLDEKTPEQVVGVEQPRITLTSRHVLAITFDVLVALLRFIFYRPIPDIPLRKGWRPIVFPSLPATTIIFAALAFTTLYCFAPQPLYWQDISFGSPPLAIRSGMIAIALMPWIIALSMKANLISLLTGLGHERLNVLHRWMGWLCLFLSLVHTIPFYVTPLWSSATSEAIYSTFFGKGMYVYGTGIAALVPLIFLCLHSLPWLRHWTYELFIVVHIPVSIVFLAMLFWHCNNYLTSWNYLYATTAIWLSSYLLRVLFYLNWSNPWRLAWLIGDESSIMILSENAIKVTMATRMKWRAGQYVYLRLPGISVFENHPFTITSLCSDDFPSAYGEGYRDMTLVFRPFRGFTQKVLEAARQNGPLHTYRAFIDGPYGGMTRSLDSFDHVLLIAGGSGITALTSHLLQLIKRMRESTAVTKTVHVIWAMKRPEVMSWFKDELRICREHAPPGSMRCDFFITAAKRMTGSNQLVSVSTPSRVMDVFHNKVVSIFHDLTSARSPQARRISQMSQRSEARRETFIQQEAAGDPERERQLRQENEDAVAPLPQAHLKPLEPRNSLSLQDKRRMRRKLKLDTSDLTIAPVAAGDQYTTLSPTHQQPNFGFPTTPTEFQKSLVRLAFLPGAARIRNAAGNNSSNSGWNVQYGRPDIAFMLREMGKDLGRRNAVFVCGPPEMRCDVARAVAELQTRVWQGAWRGSGGGGGGGRVEEVWLHTENYAL